MVDDDEDGEGELMAVDKFPFIIAGLVSRIDHTIYALGMLTS